jgi:hypothetical protein
MAALVDIAEREGDLSGKDAEDMVWTAKAALSSLT